MQKVAYKWSFITIVYFHNDCASLSNYVKSSSDNNYGIETSIEYHTIVQNVVYMENTKKKRYFMFFYMYRILEYVCFVWCKNDCILLRNSKKLEVLKQNWYCKLPNVHIVLEHKIYLFGKFFHTSLCVFRLIKMSYTQKT